MDTTPDLSDPYCYFLDDDAFRDTDRPGFRRRVVTGEFLQMCFWRIAGGATGSYLHHHVDNEQLGMVMRGKLDFRIGDDPDDDGAHRAQCRRGLPRAALGVARRLDLRG